MGHIEALQQARQALQTCANAFTIHSRPEHIPAYNEAVDAIEAIDEALKG